MHKSYYFLTLGLDWILGVRPIVSGDGVRYALTTDGRLARSDVDGTLQSSGTIDTDHLVIHYGITDEVAWADSAEGNVSYHNADNANVELAGYEYVAEGEDGYVHFGTASNGYSYSNAAQKTLARRNIEGNASGYTQLVLYYQPAKRTVHFVVGTDATATVADVTAFTDQTVTLDSHATRAGYSLRGWTNADAGAVDGFPNSVVSNLAGVNSQTAYTNVLAKAAKSARDAATGTYYTAVDGTGTGNAVYLVPTADVTLYAVWYASDTVAYTVERWLVSGTGELSPLAQDPSNDHRGSVQRDASGLLVYSTDPIRYKRYGTAGETASAEYTGADDGLTYTNDDAANVSTPGYEYVGDGQTVEFGGTVYKLCKTVGSALINGDGTTRLVLYYRPLLNTVTFYSGDIDEHVDNKPAPVQVYTDAVFELPVDVTRPGYTLEGWTNVATVKLNGGTGAQEPAMLVSDLKGAASQSAHDILAKLAGKRDSVTGAIYTPYTPAGSATPVGNATYVMPTTALNDKGVDSQAITLYAVWRAIDDAAYTVRHWRITGDGTIKEALVDTGTTGLSDTTVTAVVRDVTTDTDFTGYVFAEKAMDADGIEHVSVLSGNLEGDGSLVLDVFYKAIPTIKLTLDPGAGSWTSVDKSAEHAAESIFTLPDGTMLYRPGYDFVGWSNVPDGSAGASATGSASITTAVRLSSVGDNFVTGAEKKAGIAAEYDASLTATALLSVMANADIDPKGGITYDDPTLYYITPDGYFLMPTTSTTLYAIWRAHVYNISFDKNDGVATGQMSDSTYVYGDDKSNVSTTDYARRNAEFLGWALSANATEVAFTDDELRTALAAASVDDLEPGNRAASMLVALASGDEVTLYAIWDIEVHTATLAGGSTSVDAKGHEISTATYPGGTVTIDTDSIEPGFTLLRDAAKITVNDGYYLKGWNVTVNGVTTYIEDPDAIFSVMMNADTVFEPVFGNYAEDEAVNGSGSEGRNGLGTPRTGDSDLTAAAALLALLMALLAALLARHHFGVRP